MRLSSAAVIALLSAGPAWAVPVTYNFTGTVTQVGSMVLIPISIGEVIPIQITVNSEYPATAPGSGQFSSAGIYNPVTKISEVIQSATFDGKGAAGLIQTISVAGDAISFKTAGPQISAGFTLSLAGAAPGTFPTLDLPLTIDPGLFLTGSFSVTEAFSPTTYGYSGVINGLAAVSVPEPVSVALLGMGLAGGAAVSRRRARRTTR